MISTFRWRSREQLRAVDLAPLLALVPHLVDEWAELRFAPDGRALHARTGVPLGPAPTADADQGRSTDHVAVRLVGGSHRTPGATYDVRTVRHPVAPEEPQPGGRAGARGRPQSPPVQLPPIVHTYRAVTERDDPSGVDASVRSEDLGLEGTASIGLDPTAVTASGVGRWDLRRTFAADGPGEPRWIAGCLTALTGRWADASAHLDLGPLLGRGRSTSASLLQAQGTMRPGRVTLTVDVTPSLTTWDVDVDLRIQARGRGRLVLPFVRGRIRKALDEDGADLWPQVRAALEELRVQLASLPGEIDDAGGPRPFVHDVLWGDGEALRRLTGRNR